MQGFDPFEEDKHVMSREPVSDYSFVFSKWEPNPKYPHTTEWDEVGDEIEFRITVRGFLGQIRSSCRMPKLETKEGKDSFTATVRERLIKGLEHK